jgi:hypothetical protein
MHPSVIAYDDNWVLVRMPDGSRQQLARAGPVDQALRLPPPASSEPLTTPLIPTQEVNLGEVRPVVGRAQVEQTIPLPGGSVTPGEPTEPGRIQARLAGPAEVEQVPVELPGGSITPGTPEQPGQVEVRAGPASVERPEEEREQLRLLAREVFSRPRR